MSAHYYKPLQRLPKETWNKNWVTIKFMITLPVFAFAFITFYCWLTFDEWPRSSLSDARQTEALNSRCFFFHIATVAQISCVCFQFTWRLHFQARGKSFCAFFQLFIVANVKYWSKLFRCWLKSKRSLGGLFAILQFCTGSKALKSLKMAKEILFGKCLPHEGPVSVFQLFILNWCLYSGCVRVIVTIQSM